MYKTFLIKYAEIAIKGKNRYIFEDALVKNIKYQLRNVDGSFEVRKESGRVYVETDGDYDYDETVATLSRIFGIVGICPVELTSSVKQLSSISTMYTRIRALPSR
jgi:thiamine biosynthesis protein ThiI